MIKINRTCFKIAQWLFYMGTYLMCSYGIIRHSMNLGLSLAKAILVLCLGSIASFLLGYDEYLANKHNPDDHIKHKSIKERLH